jgi:hypothetical protein
VPAEKQMQGRRVQQLAVSILSLQNSQLLSQWFFAGPNWNYQQAFLR